MKLGSWIRRLVNRRTNDRAANNDEAEGPRKHFCLTLAMQQAAENEFNSGSENPVEPSIDRFPDKD